MKAKLIGLLLVLPLVAAEPAGYKYWNASELKGLAKTMAPKVNDKKVALENLGEFGPDRAIAVHREGSGEAELHETEADVMMIVSGSGTLVIGGTMPGAKNTAPGEQRAPAVNGGDKQKMGPGDVLHIPPKIPHQVMLAPGTQITYFVLKVKE